MVLYPNKLPESERVCFGICNYKYPSIRFYSTVHHPDTNKSPLHPNPYAKHEILRPNPNFSTENNQTVLPYYSILQSIFDLSPMQHLLIYEVHLVYDKIP